jgi:anthranilate synthase/aminodeoxychorismate synthase-like glutamine amidotransferase
MILVIDNYDSFTYNTVQALGAMNQEIVTVRNDRITVDEAKKLAPEYLVISPGPGWPQDAGISNELIKAFSGEIPVLGICLGQQCIAHVFGGKIINAPKLLHGKSSRIYHDSRTIYSGLPNPILGGRYHSLIVEEKSLPACLEVAAYTPEGEIMGIRHRDMPVEGVQFHPESILTEVGRNVFRNFLNLRRRLQ